MNHRPEKPDIRAPVDERGVGLSDEEAATRLHEETALHAAPATRVPYAVLAARQFLDPLVALLIGAVVVSAAIGEALDAAVIAAIVVLNGLLGFAQEASAERAVHALRANVQPIATVMRSGRELVLPSREVVTGDLLLLREGDRVVADGRLVESFGLEVNESMLTGESIPVAKAAADDVPTAADDDAATRVFAGTAVTRGRGTAVVSGVGTRTELARIALLTEEAKSPPTMLQRRLSALSLQMVVLGVLVTAGLTAAMALRGASLHTAFLLGVSVAVAAVPEGLAATVTIALALGARAMARRNAIVRRLGAVETLGQVSVICTDKTGTLTENRLRVAAVAPAGAHGEIDVLRGALLASSPVTARALDDPDAGGDPLELAIGRAARDAGLNGGDIDAGLRLRTEIPFDARRRRMTRVFQSGDRCLSYVKGAPEVVLGRCILSEVEHEAAEREAHAWGAQGLRVLAFAGRSLPLDVADQTALLEQDLELLGLIAFHDPLRAASADAVRDAHAAGIAVQMLTGDHLATANAVARQVGIPADRVSARISPEDKLRMIERLQDAREVVVVTGDGVNDAPALRQADVGIAMGRSGTEAAREAADVVLTDDDFATIVAAIREGRVISDNVRKVAAFLLSANLGEVALFAVAVVLGLGVPMTVIQILLVNVLTDGLPAIALARDPASDETMRTRAPQGARLFTTAVWLALSGVAAAVGASALGAYLIGRTAGPAAAQTMAFAAVALAELALVFSCRSLTLSAWRMPRNTLLLGASAVSAGLVALLVYLPAAQTLVGTTALDARQLGAVVALAIVPAALAEATKRVAAGRSGSAPATQARPR